MVLASLTMVVSERGVMNLCAGGWRLASTWHAPRQLVLKTVEETRAHQQRVVRLHRLNLITARHVYDVGGAVEACVVQNWG